MAYSNNFKVIIFDLDNTLVDRQKAAIKLMRDIILDDFPSDRYSNEFREELLDLLYQWDYEGHVEKKICFSKYIDRVKIVGRGWQYYNDIWTRCLKDYTELFDHSIEVLDYLKQKYRLAMITNGSVESQQGKLNKINISDYFEKIVISGSYGIHKPDRRIFQIMLDQLEIEPNEAMYVGDGLGNDVIGAMSVGINPIWVYPHPNVDTNIACQRIYKIEDIKELL